MIQNKIDSDDWNYGFTRAKHCFIHNFDPRFLGKNLEHRHECLKVKDHFSCRLVWFSIWSHNKPREKFRTL